MSEAGTKALAVVVVTHNSAAWMPGFFETWGAAVGGSGALQRGGVEVVVADAGSADDTVAVVRRVGGADVRIIECGDVGFGAAANRGVAATSAARILVCNPDLTFPADFVRKLIDPLLLPPSKESPLWYGGACIAPQLLNPDGSVQASVGRFPTIGGVVGDQFRAREQRKYVRPQPAAGLVDWAAGACLLLRRDKFEEVGGFDERFFLYVEEVDLQRRLWGANGQTWFAPEVRVMHHAPNASRPRRAEVQRWAARGLLRYFAKHGSAGELAAFCVLAAVSGRLAVGELLASRRAIVGRSTK